MFSVSSSKKGKLGLSFIPRFQIAVHESDSYILHAIKNFFLGIGSIRKIGLYYYYKVESFKEINEIIIPHFNNYPLLTKNKFKSFYLLKRCIDFMKDNKGMNKKQLLNLLRYKASFKSGLKSKIFETYQDIIPLDQKDIPYLPTQKINPYWLAGFVAADGSFGVYRIGGKYKNYGCTFRISQDKIDELLLGNIADFLGCGKISRSKSGMRDLGVFAISDHNTIIIPFFSKYKICTSKEKDFKYFCEIVDIFNKKGRNKRWLEEDKDKIRLLSLKMNNYRKKL